MINVWENFCLPEKNGHSEIFFHFASEFLFPASNIKRFLKHPRTYTDWEIEIGSLH